MTFEKVLNLKATNNYEVSKMHVIDSMLKTFTSIKTHNSIKNPQLDQIQNSKLKSSILPQSAIIHIRNLYLVVLYAFAVVWPVVLMLLPVDW